MKRAQILSLKAPAKINLFLEVRGKRPDGYHDLNTFMVPVSLFDRVELEPLDGGRIEILSEGGPNVPAGEGNLCHRAARFYFKETGLSGGVRVALAKAIPAGAGLGGGSSDAAVTILGLERMFGRTLSEASRSRAAFSVGADVPFFFARGAAWVKGIGEVVRQAPPFDPLWLVLVQSGAFLSTAQVFSRFTRGLTTPETAHTIAQFNFRGFVAALRNDLETAAQELEPTVGTALGALRIAGAPGALMSGSGSAVFGLFPDETAAREAAGLLRQSPGAERWRVDVVHTLLPDAFPFSE